MPPNPLTRISIVGFGRMGKEIARLAAGAGCELISYADDDKSLLNIIMTRPEVAIEFSTPEAAPKNIKRLLEAGISVLSGTTGWNSSAKHLQLLARNNRAGFLHATNFSLGVQVFIRSAAALAAALEKVGHYEFQIDETHHVHKLDSPSGTALSLQAAVTKALAKKTQVTIQATRQGEVIGYHRLKATGPHDSLQILHNAHERTGFALGALACSRWLAGRVGVLTMNDYLDDILGKA